MIDFSHKPRWAIPVCIAVIVILTLWTLAFERAPGAQPFNHQQKHELTREVQDVRDRCQAVVNGQRTQLYETFTEVFKGLRNVALVSTPDHVNKGDSVILVGEMELLASLGINVQYSCGVRDCSMQKLRSLVDEWGNNDHSGILFHGGGNFGDLYTIEHNLKLKVMREFSAVRMHVFPQSIKFQHGDGVLKETQEALSMLTNPLSSLAVRDLKSYKFAQEHFSMPNVRIDMTPDIAFYIGFRPDLRRLLAPSNPRSDLLFFRRKDVEGSKWDWAGGATNSDFPAAFTQKLSRSVGKSLTAKAGDWIDFDLTQDEKEGGHIQFRAWRRFMLGAGWLSSADFVIMDRLHGHIVSLLLGIPHILIDNNIGKLGDYFSTWTHDCPLGELVVDNRDEGSDAMSSKVQNVYARWHKAGQINGRDFL